MPENHKDEIDQASQHQSAMRTEWCVLLALSLPAHLDQEHTNTQTITLQRNCANSHKQNNTNQPHTYQANQPTNQPTNHTHTPTTQALLFFV